VRSRNHCCRGKAIRIKYTEVLSVALVMQHAKRMFRITWYSVAFLTLLYFSTLPRRRQDFQKTLLNVKCVSIFAKIFVWNISYSEKTSARYCHICTQVLMQRTPYTCRILMKSRQMFRRIIKYKISQKSFLWEPTCAMRTDGWTDGRTDGRTDGQRNRWTDNTKVTVAFRNFANAPNKHLNWLCSQNTQT
jgi:hypothetical protein